jgi:hypothetical protein
LIEMSCSPLEKFLSKVRLISCQIHLSFRLFPILSPYPC